VRHRALKPYRTDSASGTRRSRLWWFAASLRRYRVRAIDSCDATADTAQFCAGASSHCAGPLFPEVNQEAERTNQEQGDY